jgi:hypothetical protein
MEKSNKTQLVETMAKIIMKMKKEMNKEMKAKTKMIQLGNYYLMKIQRK